MGSVRIVSDSPSYVRRRRSRPRSRSGLSFAQWVVIVLVCASLTLAVVDLYLLATGLQ